MLSLNEYTNLDLLNAITANRVAASVPAGVVRDNVSDRRADAAPAHGRNIRRGRAPRPAVVRARRPRAALAVEGRQRWGILLNDVSFNSKYIIIYPHLNRLKV